MAVPMIRRRLGFTSPNLAKFTTCYTLLLRYDYFKVLLKFEFSEKREN